MAISHLHPLTQVTVIVGSQLAILSPAGAAQHLLIMPSLRCLGYPGFLGIYLRFNKHQLWQASRQLRYLQGKLSGVFKMWLMFSAIPAYAAVLASECQLCWELHLELTPCFIIQPLLQTLHSEVGSLGLQTSPISHLFCILE